MARGCIIAAICVAAVLIVGMGIAAWFIFRTVKPPNMSMREFARVTEVEAQKFARDRRDVDCVDEAMRRADATNDMAGQARASMFLQPCLDAARNTGLCSRVPRGFFDGARWAAEQCRNRPQRATGDPCVGIMNGVYQACSRRHLRR